MEYKIYDVYTSNCEPHLNLLAEGFIPPLEHSENWKQWIQNLVASLRTQHECHQLAVWGTRHVSEGAIIAIEQRYDTGHGELI